MKREGITREEGPGAGMLNRILGGEVRDNNGNCGNEGKYEKRKYMGGKGRGMWGSTLEEGPGASMLNRILEGEVWDKHGNCGNEGKYEKRKYMGGKGREM